MIATLPPKLCPRCGAECWRDDVDIGVGIQYGPWRCSECPWDERYDLEMPEVEP